MEGGGGGQGRGGGGGGWSGQVITACDFIITCLRGSLQVLEGTKRICKLRRTSERRPPGYSLLTSLERGANRKSVTYGGTDRDNYETW